MAVGSGGRIVTSPDGVNWTVRSSITANGLNAVIFASDTFLAAGAFGSIVQSDHWSRLQLGWPSGPVLNLFGEVGQTYQIQSRDDLLPATIWTSRMNLTLTNNPHTWADPSSSGISTKFYRVVQEP